MSTTREPCWVLLAANADNALSRLIDDAPLGAQWRLVRGTGEVDALVEDELGTEHSGERELAEKLSYTTRCYLGYFDPPWISACDQGQWQESQADPFELARSLGCPLRGEPAPFEAPPLSALVIQGVTPQELAKALSWPWPLPARDARNVIEVPLGAAAWDEDGDLIDYALQVARQLQLPMYTVEWRADKVLRCEYIEHAEVKASFDNPSSWWSESPSRLPNVLGHTEPAAILTTLGLPLAALNIKSN